jgi:integrase
MPPLVLTSYAALMGTKETRRQRTDLPPTHLQLPPETKLPKQRGGKSGRARSHRGGGSVYQRSDGLWVAQIRHRGQVHRAYARDWNSADEKLRHLRARAGTAQPAEAQTVAEFVEAWLYYEEHAKWGTLRSTTIRGYRQLLRDYVLPEIGVRDIKGPWRKSDFSFLSDRRLPGDTRRFQSRSTLHNLRAVTHRLFAKAVAWEKLDANPLIKDWWPSGRVLKSGGTILTANQAGRLIDAAWRVSPAVAPIIALALYTGARLGELLALRWGAVNLDPPFIEIRQTLTRKIDRGYGFDAPKTDKSRRRIRLNAEAAEMVMNLPSRVGSDEDTLLFPSPYAPRDDYGNERPYGWHMPISPSHVYHELQRSLHEAGLPKVRVHDLRHTAASLMLAAGVETVVVSAVLGHKSPSITHDMYSHVLPGRDWDAVDHLSFRGEAVSVARTSDISTSVSTTEGMPPRSEGG